MAENKDQWAQNILAALNKVAYSPSISWNQASTYAALPDPSTDSGSTWLVLTSTGIWPLSKPAGWYCSTGETWAYLGSYNPVVSGGNVVVTNFPQPASTGEGLSALVTLDGIRLLAPDSARKGFVLTLEQGIVYIGLGFMPTDSQYTYRMTNNSVVEKDGFTGPVFGIADQVSKEIYITEIK